MMGDIRERLANISIFEDLADSSERIAKIERRLKVQTYKMGDPIITEGEEGDTLHILNRGSVRILRNTLESESFALVNLDAGQNVFFGEIALIDSDRRSATVIALTDCETLTLSRNDYLSLCEEDPYIGYKITFRIAMRMGESLRKSSRDLMTVYQALLDEIS